MLALAIAVPELCSRDAPSSYARDRRRSERHRFGGHSGGETPGPIPNPEVKPSSADGTAWVTGWESRSLAGTSLRTGRLRAARSRSSRTLRRRCPKPSHPARRAAERRPRPSQRPACPATCWKRSARHGPTGRSTGRDLASRRARSSCSSGATPGRRSSEADEGQAVRAPVRRGARGARAGPVRARAWQEALTEMKTYRRMSGRVDQNHVIADCLRGIGRPAEAVPLAEEELRGKAPNEAKAEAVIVAASALADQQRYAGGAGVPRQGAHARRRLGGRTRCACGT